MFGLFLWLHKVLFFGNKIESGKVNTIFMFESSMKLDADSVAISSLTLDPDYADAAEVQRMGLNKTKSRDRDPYKNW